MAAECEVPAAPEHGRLLDGSRQQARDTFPDGATVSFECEDDYRLVGSRSITCEKGQWSDDPPVCTVSRCPVLNIPDHVVIEGVHFNDGRNIGDERIFNCVVGYVLRGDTNNLRCLESGVWSDPLPTCEESTEPPKNNGSCSNSCCTSSEYSCNPEGCYCDSWCEWNNNCCDDYEDVCPSEYNTTDVFISNTTYNMRGGEQLLVFTPNYPNNYNNLENILWHVRYVHGSRFIITLGTVRMHSIRDYVRIYTGISDVFEESTQIVHLTYNSTGDLLHSYWSIHPNMWLQFSTDAFGTDQGFFMAIGSAYGDCDGSFFQCTNAQCIYSPGICDGFSDCVDSSDEYCSVTTTRPGPTVLPTPDAILQGIVKTTDNYTAALENDRSLAYKKFEKEFIDAVMRFYAQNHPEYYAYYEDTKVTDFEKSGKKVIVHFEVYFSQLDNDSSVPDAHTVLLDQVNEHRLDPFSITFGYVTKTET